MSAPNHRSGLSAISLGYKIIKKRNASIVKESPKHFSQESIKYFPKLLGLVWKGCRHPFQGVTATELKARERHRAGLNSELSRQIKAGDNIEAEAESKSIISNKSSEI